MNFVLKIVLISLLSLSFYSCSDTSSEQQTRKKAPTISLIFLDKSVSLNLNADFVKQKYEPIVRQILKDNIQQEGDKIEVWYIHQNTSKGKAMQLMSRATLPDLNGMSPSDADYAKSTHEVELGREHTLMFARIKTLLEAANQSASKEATDVSATLPIIDKTCQEWENVRVYYFSDMIESNSASSSRIFDKNPPKDATQAEEWAKIDAKNWQSRLNSISMAEVKVILPYPPTANTSTNNPQISNYWQKLFENLGLSPSFE
jgi:hypothetical protein